jgi:hypothetical protein
MYQLHVGWTGTYMIIIILLLMAEMYAVGAGKHWSLTENTVAVVQRAPWLGVPILLFLAWLLFHFAIRLVPVMLGREPITWL